MRTLAGEKLDAVDIGRLEIPGRWFRRSCCRVRGRVVRRIRLANGHVIERPLCNARVVICEVEDVPGDAPIAPHVLNGNGGPICH